jgi:hypothetical protein
MRRRRRAALNSPRGEFSADVSSSSRAQRFRDAVAAAVGRRLVGLLLMAGCLWFIGFIGKVVLA